MSADRPDPVDRRWMRAAVNLARRGEGWTRPNPPVGAVVVKDGKAVGRGWHQKAGGPHAEIHALAQAGESARGATLYVTLEPCSTYGRTPPCTDAIQAAGIRRVVAGTGDPNPSHALRGFQILEKAGLATLCGVLEKDCRELIASFSKWIRRGMPYVTLKLALTADGRIADMSGQSRWITGPDARAEVHRLRRRADAILVGAKTVIADDPGLLPQGANPNPVYRVVIDGHGRTPVTARIFNDENVERTILCTTHDCPESRCKRWEARGATVWGVQSRKGRIMLTEVLRLLGKKGLLHVVCEGGGILAEGLVREGLVDEFWFFYAPKLLGGRGVPGIGGNGWLLDEAPQLTFDGVFQVGDDLLVRAFPKREGG